MKPDGQNGDLIAELLPEFHASENESTKTGTINGAVFNISTTMIGAGIMSIPVTMKFLGIIPGVIALIAFGLLTEVSVEFMLSYTRLGSSNTYGGLMGESFGHLGSLALRITVIFSNLGSMIIYLIIIGDVFCGSNSAGELHLGILQQWFGNHWWNSRAYGILFIVIFMMLPLLSLRRIDSLKYTSALSVILAIVFIILTSAMAISAMWEGKTQEIRLVPDISGSTTIFDLFNTIPVLVTAFAFHLNVHPIRAELKQPNIMRSAVRISLVLGVAIYIAVGLSGYMLFGDSIMPDMLLNFDQSFDSTMGQLLSDCTRICYALHLVLVFPLVNYSLRSNIDELLFAKREALSMDTPRFVLLTSFLLAFIYLLGVVLPDIWVVFQFMGSTTVVCMTFIFPAAIVLRNIYGTATRRDRLLAVVTVILAVATSIIALSNNLYNMID